MRRALLLLVLGLGVLAVLAQDHPQWIQVDQDKCGGCEKDHTCYKPKLFDYPRMCIPNQFEINLSFKRSLPKYCKTLLNDFFDNRMQPHRARKVLL